MIRSIAAASAIALASIVPAVTAHAHTSGTGTVYNTQQCLDAKAAVARVQTALRNEAAQISEHNASNPSSLSSTVAAHQATHDAFVASSAILAGVAGQTGC